MSEKIIPRNLVKLGTNSLVLTIPKSWIDKNKLNKGDIVYILEKNNDIVIRTDNKPIEEIKEIIIEYSLKNHIELRSKLISAYTTGYDLIKIKKNRDSETKAIKEAVHNLVGLEIIEQTKNFIVAHELLDIEKSSIKNITRRVDYIVRGMLEDILTCKTKNEFQNIYDRDFDVNRLTFLILRTINKALNSPTLQNSLKLTTKELMNHMVLIFNLERIGDNAKRIANINCFSKKKNTKITETIIHLTDIYAQTLETYYKIDTKKAFALSIRNEERIISLKKILNENLSQKQVETIYLLQDISRDLRDISRIVCGMA
jgi:phosphate uptake regulator